MKKILSPTDFSDRSVEAYNFASQVALALPADLILFHASTQPLNASDALIFKEPKDFPVNIKVENKQLLETWQSLKNSESESGKKVKFDFIIEQGFPLASIVKAVQKYGIDLVIMHTKADQRDSFEGIHLGSVAAQVFEEVNCAVLLVPSGIRHLNINNMVYAVNLQDYDLNSVKKTILFARPFNAHIHFVYLESFGNAKDLVEKFKMELPFEFEAGNISVETFPVHDYVKDLNRILKDKNANMLVMERHQKTILHKLFSKSLVKEMSYHTRIPLLIMHVNN